MKTSTLLAVLFFTTQAFAEGFAPVSLSNQVYTVVVSSGSGLFATTGIASKVFLGNGQAVVLDSSGDILAEQRATYTYAKTGANTGTIRESMAGGAVSTQALLTFSSPVTGAYTANIVAGGVGTQTASFSLAPSTPPPLINLSTRARVAPGGQFIAGFVAGGASTTRVVVRAVGPTLTAFGVGGAMSNPSIQIYRAGSSTPLAANAVWGSSPAAAAALKTAFSAVGAFPLPDDSRDSALLLNLEPGAYTAVVSGGAAPDGGEVLIEVYLFP